MNNNPTAYGISPPTPLYQAEWPYSLEMSAETAMNGFLLYSLLLDKSEHYSHLILPHESPTQKDCLMDALAECNKAMEGIRQEEWAHACDLCFQVHQVPDGMLGEPLYNLSTLMNMTLKPFIVQSKYSMRLAAGCPLDDLAALFTTAQLTSRRNMMSTVRSTHHIQLSVL